MVAFLLLLWVCAAGVLIARRLDPDTARPAEALALGATLGLALFAACGFILGWTLGLTATTVFGAAALTMAIGVGLGASPRSLPALMRERPRASRGVIVLSVLTVILVARLADQTLYEQEGGIATGDRHNFGDLTFHMAIAAGFSWGDNFPPAHPELAGVTLTYPFFCDLISGMILAVGGSWGDAFFWPTLFLGLAVVVALVRFGEAVTASRALGRTGAALTLFSGGLGFLSLTSAQAISTWWTNGPDLTINDTGIRYANFILTLFIPQRAILFGWPLLFFALALMVESLGKKDRAPSWLKAGILTSLLPLVHSHSFAVLGFVALFLAARAGLAATLAFAKGVIPLAAPAILYMLTHNSLSTGKFFEWQPGFDGGAAQPLRYWLMNAGLFLPLVILGIARAGSGSMRFLAAPFALLFLLANLFRLSPWMWDNMKFMAPAHAGLAPFAALALALAWRHSLPGKGVAALGLLAATLSGALDISKVAAPAGSFRIFEPIDLAFAEKVRSTTPPDLTILTAPIHNHGVLLSGRRVFMGYEGHLWSQGLDYLARKPVAEAVFRGEAQPRKNGTPAFITIDAIAVTPAELPLIPNPEPLLALPSLIESPYRLFKVR